VSDFRANCRAYANDFDRTRCKKNRKTTEEKSRAQISSGQSVDLIPRVIRQAAKGSYEIIRLMPENENDPQYCVKRAAEWYERGDS